MDAKYRKNQRVQTTMEGRTAKWPNWTNPQPIRGHVTHVKNGKAPRVYVIWDGCHFEDEMFLHEVKAF